MQSSAQRVGMFLGASLVVMWAVNAKGRPSSAPGVRQLPAQSSGQECFPEWSDARAAEKLMRDHLRQLADLRQLLRQGKHILQLQGELSQLQRALEEAGRSAGTHSNELLSLEQVLQRLTRSVPMQHAEQSAALQQAQRSARQHAQHIDALQRVRSFSPRYRQALQKLVQSAQAHQRALDATSRSLRMAPQPDQARAVTLSLRGDAQRISDSFRQHTSQLDALFREVRTRQRAELGSESKVLPKAVETLKAMEREAEEYTQRFRPSPNSKPGTPCGARAARFRAIQDTGLRYAGGLKELRQVISSPEASRPEQVERGLGTLRDVEQDARLHMDRLRALQDTH